MTNNKLKKVDVQLDMLVKKIGDLFNDMSNELDVGWTQGGKEVSEPTYCYDTVIERVICGENIEDVLETTHPEGEVEEDYDEDSGLEVWTNSDDTPEDSERYHELVELLTELQTLDCEKVGFENYKIRNL